MITVAQAEQIILENTIKISIENVAIDAALGRILAEDLCADRDFPPFNRVTMDGIAVQFAQLEAGQTTFEIEATAAAGNFASNRLKNFAENQHLNASLIKCRKLMTVYDYKNSHLLMAILTLFKKIVV